MSYVFNVFLFHLHVFAVRAKDFCIPYPSSLGLFVRDPHLKYTTLTSPYPFGNQAVIKRRSARVNAPFARTDRAKNFTERAFIPTKSHNVLSFSFPRNCKRVVRRGKSEENLSIPALWKFFSTEFLMPSKATFASGVRIMRRSCKPLKPVQ